MLMTIIPTFIKNLVAFICACLSTYIVGTLFVTQININSVTNQGVTVNLSQRLGSAINDLVNMLPLYSSLIVIALLIALLFTRMVLTRFIQPSTVLYALAGFVALLVLHLALYVTFNMSAIAATRSIAGLLSQGLAGALGGALFFTIHRALPFWNKKFWNQK